MLQISFAHLRESLVSHQKEPTLHIKLQSDNNIFPVSNGELLEKIFSSKQGDKAKKLFDGNWKGAGYASASEADMAFSSILAFWTAKNPQWIDSIVRESCMFREKWDEKRGSHTYGQITISNAIEGCTEAYSWDKALLPIITIKGGGLSNEATKAEEALISSGIQIYQRGKNLVRPVIQEVEAADGKRTNIAQLIEIDAKYLRDKLCSVAIWKKYNKNNEAAEINPPHEVVDTVLHRYGDWKFHVIVGIISTPTIRPNGSLLHKEGYDSTTRLLLHEPLIIPEIPDHPSYEKGLEALAIIEGLLEEFSFKDEASRSVALSALITPVVRPACNNVPLHVADSPTSGSGKSFLFDIASTIATGHKCPVMAAGKSEEETEKRLGAAVMTGQAIISIDNVNGDLGGDALCQIVERPIVDIRILGKSENVRIESKTTLFATGNNIRPIGDMNRRSLICSIDTQLERPELKEFKRNPINDILGNRAKYVVAILTLIRAYIVAGRPNKLQKLASFEAWSDTVRSALAWYGKADPVDTMRKAREEDPLLQNMRTVFSALWEVIGSEPYTISKLFELINHSYQQPDKQEKFSTLRDAIIHASGGKTQGLDVREFGKWMSRHKGRISNGLKLENITDSHGHPARWFLTQCGSSG